MALNDYAFYNKDTGLIENVVWLDDNEISSLVNYPPEGYAIVDIPNEGVVGEWSSCGIGWSYIDGQFVEPPEPAPPEGVEQPISQGAQTL